MSLALVTGTFYRVTHGLFFLVRSKKLDREHVAALYVAAPSLHSSFSSMDFSDATKRLQRDQASLRSRRRSKPQLSQAAQQEASRQRRQQALLLERRAKEKRQLQHQEDYFSQCERVLNVRPLGVKGGSLQLQATSIHGDGDKIALPVSVLERITSQELADSSESPWIFRISVPNQGYKFPASEAMRNLPDEDELHEIEEEAEQAFYLEELANKYKGYTHGTVVEFSQEEGHIGLPRAIASVLFRDGVTPTRTVDPSKSDPTAMDMDEGAKTAGHLAWGSFDVPVEPIEVSLVQIPKGKSCRMRPTSSAIMKGFYNLDNVKLVLEQSLVRTRATLSVGDSVSTWHRGTEYMLQVTEVSPSTYHCVTCINTDIEVEFEAAEGVATPVQEQSTVQTCTEVVTTSGYTLNGSQPVREDIPAPIEQSAIELKPEPQEDQRENICTVQVRANGKQGRRRFDVTDATVKDLFEFAASVAQLHFGSFRLVTRFPRRLFTSEGEQSQHTLHHAGISQGQELFMVENL